jgi:hydroxymethylglutaryl-CoA lyase
MSNHVEIVEVAPRDGLQSDPATLSTADKVALIGRAGAAGLRRVEAVSFVNPKRVPQMADADEVMAALRSEAGGTDMSYIGLVLNRRGFDRAVECGVDEVNVVVVCTDSFAEKNQGQPTQGLIDTWLDISGAAHEVGMRASVTLAASFGCPYEGEVPLDRLVGVATAGAAGRPHEIAIADSIGVAVPTDVRERVDAVGAVAGGAALRCHFHNTRNTGLANAVAAVEAGVRVLDASLGGIGGCPFAPNATGNIPTEDLVYLLERMGYDTGVDLGALVSNIAWLEATLGHTVPGLVGKAGVFPAVRP